MSNIKMKNNSIVMLFSKITGVDLNKRNRSRSYSWIRFACYKYLFEKDAPKGMIAKMFGVTHSTVVYGINQMNEKLSVCDKLAEHTWTEMNEIFEDFTEFNEEIHRLKEKEAENAIK